MLVWQRNFEEILRTLLNLSPVPVREMCLLGAVLLVGALVLNGAAGIYRFPGQSFLRALFIVVAGAALTLLALTALKLYVYPAFGRNFWRISLVGSTLVLSAVIVPVLMVLLMRANIFSALLAYAFMALAIFLTGLLLHFSKVFWSGDQAERQRIEKRTDELQRFLDQ